MHRIDLPDAAPPRALIGVNAQLILILCACVAIATLLCIAALFATVLVTDSLFDKLIEIVLAQPPG